MLVAGVLVPLALVGTADGGRSAEGGVPDEGVALGPAAGPTAIAVAGAPPSATAPATASTGAAPAGLSPAGLSPTGVVPTGAAPTSAAPTSAAPTGVGSMVTRLAFDTTGPGGVEPAGPGARTFTVRREATAPFGAVAVTWSGGGVERVAVRTHRPGGDWGTWQTPQLDQGGRPAALAWVGRADGVEVMVNVSGGRTPENLTAELIDPGDAATDAAPEATPATGGGPAILRRADWGADERAMTWQPGYARGGVRTVAVGTLLAGAEYAPADVPRMLRVLYHFDAVSRGFGDLGVHVVVDRFGRLWEGRYGGLARAVVGTARAGTVRVALLGTITAPAPAAVVEPVARYAAWKLAGVAQPQVTAAGALGGQLTNRVRELTRHTPPRLAVWRPATGGWWLYGQPAPAWQGAPGDVPVPADYDGDGLVDLALWSPSTGTWTIRNSAAGTTEQLVHGGAGERPVPADYDGDGRADPATWHPGTGVWQVRGAAPLQWGTAGDQPVPADYDGDGRAEPATWTPKTGVWSVLGGARYRLGEAWHVPVPADYDGDGAAEPASYSPTTYRWFVFGEKSRRFGGPGGVPVPGRYDGDRRADRAVWYPPTGGGTAAAWRIDGGGAYLFGETGDIPILLG